MLEGWPVEEMTLVVEDVVDGGVDGQQGAARYRVI
jgi:hypothetical protein